MANRHRGEIEAVLDGKAMRLCLTLGALADLETAFGAADMLELAERFESGRIKASDAVRIIGAGLRGAGLAIDDREVAAMRCERGAAGYVEIVAALLAATFGGPETAAASASASAKAIEQAAAPGEERGSPAPFPGTR